jgi:hypothetical protein
LTGPVFGSVIVAISAVVGNGGGAFSFFAGIPLVHRDTVSMERLRAIDRAAAILHDAAGLV